MIHCRKCGKENNDDNVYCIDCGSKIEGKVICDDCGKAVNADARYCPSCGARISNEPLSEIEISEGKKPKNKKLKGFINLFSKICCILFAVIFVGALFLPLVQQTFGQNESSIGLLEIFNEEYFNTIKYYFENPSQETIASAFMLITNMVLAGVFALLIVVFSLISIIRNAIALFKFKKDPIIKPVLKTGGLYFGLVLGITMINGGIVFGENTFSGISIYPLCILGISFVTILVFFILRTIFVRDNLSFKTFIAAIFKYCSVIGSIVGVVLLESSLINVSGVGANIASLPALFVSTDNFIFAVVVTLLSGVLISIIPSSISFKLNDVTYKNRGYISKVIKEILLIVTILGVLIALLVVSQTLGSTIELNITNLILIVILEVASLALAITGHILATKKKSKIVFLQ